MSGRCARLPFTITFAIVSLVVLPVSAFTFLVTVSLLVSFALSATTLAFSSLSVVLAATALPFSTPVAFRVTFWRRLSGCVSPMRLRSYVEAIASVGAILMMRKAYRDWVQAELFTELIESALS